MSNNRDRLAKRENYGRLVNYKSKCHFNKPKEHCDKGSMSYHLTSFLSLKQRQFCTSRRVYPKVPGLAACSENCKRYSNLPL